MPDIAWMRLSAPQSLWAFRTESDQPPPDGLVGDINPAFDQHLRHLAQAETQAGVEPDSMGDGLCCKAVPLVAVR